MPTTPYTQVSSASLAGLVTDGNALLNTEQSNLEESNYEMMRDGTRRRRRPIVEEYLPLGNSNSTPTYIPTTTNSPVSSYLWKTPGFRDNLSIVCQEIERQVRFYLVDHDNPEYVRENEILQDRLLLDLWNNVMGEDKNFDPTPCTYCEGNGSLYIFNKSSGTIRVELLEDNRLRMTPVGTWVRDYRGTTEQIDANSRLRRASDISVYRPELPGITVATPFIDDNDGVALNVDLLPDRAYNLSNTGWDGQGVFDFMDQSPQQSFYPATTDRYLSGRQIEDDGSDIFSFTQLDKAKKNSNMPPQGARITDSRRSGAGSLVSRPSDMLSDSLITRTGGVRHITVTHNTPVFNYPNEIGRTNQEAAVFIHCMTFTIRIGDQTFQGGFSGYLPAEKVGSDGKQLRFDVDNELVIEYGNFELTSLYLHPSPRYFPHRVEGIYNQNGFDHVEQGPRPQAGAYFAGRLWQTGDSHNRLYFSQIVDTATQVSPNRSITTESLCFAAADPTDGDDNAVVISDGGYINTNDSGTHYGLCTLGDSLILMTDRGIYAIRPGTQGVFSASNYQFTKVVEAELLGIKSWVSTGDTIQVATDEGILKLTMQSTSFGNTSVVVEKMLDNRLMYGYLDILEDWPQPIASYDPDSRVVRWVFTPKRGTETTLLDKQQPMLSYSTHHNAWFKYDLGLSGQVLEMFVMPYTAKSETYNRFRYLVDGYKISPYTAPFNGWAVEVEFDDVGNGTWIENGLHTYERFADFRRSPNNVTNEPREATPAYMLTNHMIPGQGINWAQINYITVHNRNVTKRWISQGNVSAPSIDGGTLLSVRWDWMNQNSTGKWSHPYQTYRYRRTYIASGESEANARGEPVLVHKMKLRGRGREFRLFFESDEHKDSHIEGWAYQGYVLNEV